MKRSEIFIGLDCLLDGEPVTVTGLDGVGGRIIVEGPQNGEEAVSCSKLKPLSSGRAQSVQDWEEPTFYD